MNHSHFKFLLTNFNLLIVLIQINFKLILNFNQILVIVLKFIILIINFNFKYLGKFDLINYISYLNLIFL